MDFSIDNVFSDEKKLRKYYEKCILLTDVMSEHVQVNGVLVCPFHNDHKPSSKLYVNEDGSQNIYCYTENKMYSSYDYVTLVLGMNPISFLMKNYSEEELNHELENVDFTGDSSSSKISKLKFSELIEESKMLLPDVISYLNNFYDHGIEVKNDTVK